MADARKKILCIEDDRETAKLIAEELSERGFYVVIAYEASIGLAAILRNIPDLVLCDIVLPRMSGFQVLSSVNTSLPRPKRVPFIFLTGSTSRLDELQGRRLGADDYVTKPIDFDILETIIRARLAGGIARHKMFADPARSLQRNRHGDAMGSAAQIVELVDAPTVDFQAELGHEANKAAVAQAIKP
jgi:DNA-binding response OmpR family regulator